MSISEQEELCDIWETSKTRKEFINDALMQGYTKKEVIEFLDGEDEKRNWQRNYLKLV